MCSAANLASDWCNPIGQITTSKREPHRATGRRTSADARLPRAKERVPSDASCRRSSLDFRVPHLAPERIDPVPTIQSMDLSRGDAKRPHAYNAAYPWTHSPAARPRGMPNSTINGRTNTWPGRSPAKCIRVRQDPTADYPGSPTRCTTAMCS